MKTLPRIHRRFAGGHGRKLLLVAALSLTLMGAGDADHARFVKLGSRLMCPCSCSQMLLECNHVGCPDSDKMRAELAARVSSGDEDEAILSGFVDTYGATVLAAPRRQGFDLVAWIMPFVALALGIVASVWFVRRWQARHMQPRFAAGNVSPSVLNEFRRRAREETEL
ncbi:MAG: cytochrome c-type biogenesis protein CcmH [Acidobacteria bacterium]|nr:cytochrome c-type biogenesis protein CcmH [Acidobacteriota bacterium]